MDRQDFVILEELLDSIEQLRQRVGSNPGRGHRSSSQQLRRDLAAFADACQLGQLYGRARKRKSGELFRKIMSLDLEAR
jgi:hypothetical protein